MSNKTKKLVLSALLLAAGLVLPFLTGSIPNFGRMLLPMHLPVLLCGFVCGWKWGLLVGFVTPLLRSVLFGMPPMVPTALAMAFERFPFPAGGAAGGPSGLGAGQHPDLQSADRAELHAGGLLDGRLRHGLAGHRAADRADPRHRAGAGKGQADPAVKRKSKKNQSIKKRKGDALHAHVRSAA